MRTIEKIFPNLFAAIGITLAASWFALIIMGKASLITNVLFLFGVAFIFELYSNNQEIKAAKRSREDEEALDGMLRKLEEEHESADREVEDELFV
ncbi:MAG: hypothetical protein H6564_13245 [Lewinellaceae bacterium]|nr:hypothetical protein [Lewinellaceae bacterium]